MKGRQFTLDLGQRPAQGREDFLVAPCNETAVAWLDRWPAWPAPALTLYGPAGCGKSHLAEVWRARSGARIVGLAALADDDLRQAAATIIEDVDAGLTPALEAPLLHLYNWLAEGGGHLLLTARTPPARWPLGLADLASRLKAAPAVGVALPDEPLIAALLVKLFADRQLRVGEGVIAFLLGRMERSFAAARALVAALDAAALSSRRNITVPLAGAVLAAWPAALDEKDAHKEREEPWISD